MTHRDRVGDPPGRRGAAGDAGHRQGFPTPSGGSPQATGTAAAQGFRAASPAARDAPHRHATRSWPKTLGSRLYESLSALLGMRFQKKLATYKLLIVDELGFVPLSKTGAELLFEVFSQRYERGSTLVTTNLPFDEWTEVFGSERLTGALLDRLTHHVNILEMNGDSYRLNQSRRRQTTTAN